MPRGLMFGIALVFGLTGGPARGDILYVSDVQTGLISTVGPEGSSTGGTTFASGFDAPFGMAFDSSGNLYVANTNVGTINKVTPDGSVSTFVSGFDLPFGLAFDASGNLYVADGGTGQVDKVAPDASVSTFASGFGVPFGLTFDADGNLYVSDSLPDGDGSIYKVSPDGTVDPFASGLYEPSQMAFDSSGNLYVAEYGFADLLQVASDGSYTAFAFFSPEEFPSGVAIDSSGNIYVSVSDGFGTGTIYMVPECGCVIPFATGFDNPEFLAFGPQTPNPEPGSLALVGTVTVIAGLYRWRRRGEISLGSPSEARLRGTP